MRLVLIIANKADISPADAQFALSGSEDGTVHRWHIQSGQALPPLSGAHSSPVCAVKCSPTRQMVVSACSALCLWEQILCLAPLLLLSARRALPAAAPPVAVPECAAGLLVITII